MAQDWNTDFIINQLHGTGLTTQAKYNAHKGTQAGKAKEQIAAASGANSGKTGPKKDDQGAGHGKKLSGGGRFLYRIPGAWADRVGGTRGEAQSLNIEAGSQFEAKKKLIRLGIPATIVNGFDVSKTKSTASATNLLKTYQQLPAGY